MPAISRFKKVPGRSRKSRSNTGTIEFYFPALLQISHFIRPYKHKNQKHSTFNIPRYPATTFLRFLKWGILKSITSVRAIQLLLMLMASRERIAT